MSRTLKTELLSYSLPLEGKLTRSRSISDQLKVLDQLLPIVEESLKDKREKAQPSQKNTNSQTRASRNAPGQRFMPSMKAPAPTQAVTSRKQYEPALRDQQIINALMSLRKESQQKKKKTQETGFVRNASEKIQYDVKTGHAFKKQMNSAPILRSRYESK